VGKKYVDDQTTEAYSGWDSEAKYNDQLYEDYNDFNRQAWLKNVTKDKDFYLGKQWTQDEKNEIEERGQSALVVQRVFPIIRQKLAQVTQKNPSFRVVGIDDSDNQVSHMMNNLLTYVWNISKGRTVLRRAVEDSLVKGMGYLYAYVDKFGDFGRGEVKIRHLNPEDVMVDPNSRESDFDDSENILIVKDLTRPQVKRLLPDWSDKQIAELEMNGDSRHLYKSELISYQEPISPEDGDSHEDKYRWIERYTKIKLKHYIYEKDDHNVEVLTQAEYDEMETDLRNQVELGEIAPEYYSDFESRIIETYLDRVEVCISVSNKKVSSTILPISYYPIIPFINIYTGMPYGMSDVSTLRGMQKEVNKRRSLMIAHANVSTVPRLLLQDGAVVNEGQLERDWARPGAIIKYLRGFEKPEQQAPTPLPNALYQLESEAKYDMEYTAGVFGVSMGDPQQAPETFRGTMAIEEFGNRRIQLTADMVNDALTALGKVLVEFIQATYTIEKTIRLVEPDGDVIVNTINQPIYDSYQNVTSKVNDITVGRFDVFYVAGSTLASNRWAMLNELKELYTMGIVDDIEVLKKTEVFDTPRLIERKSQLSQAMQQNKEMQEGVKNLMQEVEKLRNKNIQLEKKLILQDYKAELQETLDGIGIEKIKDEALRELEKKEMALEKKKAKATSK
jgi:hypothetical protein